MEEDHGMRMLPCRWSGVSLAGLAGVCIIPRGAFLYCPCHELHFSSQILEFGYVLIHLGHFRRHIEACWRFNGVYLGKYHGSSVIEASATTKNIIWTETTSCHVRRRLSSVLRLGSSVPQNDLDIDREAGF